MLGKTANRVLWALAVAGAFLLLPLTAAAQYVIGPGPGGTAPIMFIEPTGTRTIDAFPGFLGGISVTLGDVNGDGVADVIAGAGPDGGPHVKVFNGIDLSELASFLAFDPGFTGGVHVAAGDIDGDGRADIIVGAGAGATPHVRVFSGANLSELASFFAYNPLFNGGVTVAAGDVNGDGRADIVTGAGEGGGPHVRVLSGLDLSELAGFFAYDPAFDGGVFVAAGDLDGDGLSDIVTGAGPGGGPHVKVFSGLDQSELASFFGFDPAFTGGVSVATGDIDGDGRVDLILGAGDPHVRVLSGVDLSELASFLTPPGFGFSISVGSIGDPPGVRFTSPATTTFTVGSAGSFTVTTQGGPVPAITLSGTLPTGVTFTDNGDRTATLAGTPAAGTGGSYALTFTADNGIGTPRTQTFTLTVNEAPAITSGAATTFTIGAAGTFAVTTSGFPLPAITRTGATLPTGVTWTDNGNGTGTLGGTPDAGSGGTYAITFTADNGVGAAATQTFTLTVNGAPTFTSAAATTFTVGSAGTFAVTTVATPAATLSVGSLPAGLTFVDNGTGTGTLGGTPAAGTGGTHTLTFTATNSVGSATQSFTLTVNEAPAITSAATATFPLGAPSTFQVTTRGFPLPTIAVTGTLPNGVTFQSNPDGTGTLSGTPTGPGGIFPLTFTATNSLGTSAPQAFTLTVNASPGFTSATTTTFTVGVAGTFTVTAAGTPAPTLSLSGALPAGVTFNTATGVLSGIPQVGTGGVYALTFTAANGILPDATQAFTLNVNEGPAITSAAAVTFTVGTPGTFTVTTSGQPAPSITLGGTALPAGVTFTDNGNGTGTLAGTPAAGTGGTYAITFTATNVAGSTAPQAFTLTVNQAPAFTSAAATAFTVGVAGTFSITTSGFPAITTITRGGVALPAGVNYTDNGNGTATLAGTPAAGTGGTYALTFTINNGVGGNVVQNFTLTINAPPAITSATSTTFTVGTPGTFTVTTTGFPTPTVSQTGTLPTGVTFTPATNVLAGTATQTGAFPLVFTATNAIPPDATQNFTLNVVCPTITVNPATMPEGLFMVAYPGVTFTQTGSTGSTITWSATGLPAGLTISPTTGAVTGTPTNTVLNAAVVITATDNFGCPGTRATTITVRPVAGADAFTGGVGNTQFVVGASVTTPAVVKAGNVKGNDSGPGTLTVTFNAPASGAVAEGPTDGTFVYTPNVAFGGPTDTFTYTLTDGNGVTNTGTVTIALSGMVWYVNNSGGNGDGRSHNPFNTLVSASTASGAGSLIYVHTGGGATTPTPGALTLEANQTVHGAGGIFALNDLIIGAASKPTLSGTVTVANSSLIQFVNFVTGTTAITGNGTSGLTLNDVDIAGIGGAGTGIALTSVTGAIDLNDVDFNSPAAGSVGLSLTNVTGTTDVDSNSSFGSGNGAEVLINGGTGNVSIAPPIANTAGRSIDIQNRTGGTVTFSGAITDTGQGIFLNANTGSTINFTGALSLTTGANPAFTATNGGTVSNSNAVVNTITTTTGTALNVASTTIGAGGLTFRSISAGTGAGGPVNGIVLNGTGALGSLSVTGTGSASSGGIIQFTTGAGISLTNTLHPQFAWMNIHDIGQNGIDGQQVTNFTLTNSIINNVGTAAAGQYNENNIAFNDAGAFTSSSVSGTVTITNNTLTNARRHGIQIENGTGTIANLTISNNVLTSSTSAAASLGTAILVLAQGSATLNAHVTTGTIASNTITNFPSGEGIFIGGGAGNVANNTSSTLGANGTPISITGNAISGQAAAGQHLGSNAIRASFNGQVGVANFSITNNGTAMSPITNIQGQGISVFMGGTVTGTTTINNNFIVANQTLAAGTQGLAVQIDDGPAGAGTSAADYNLVITNNSVSAYEGNGIRAIARASLGKMDVTIQNNTVGTPSLANRNGIRIDSGSAVGDVTVCLAISGNTSDGSGANAGIGLRKQGTVAATNDFGIVGLSPSPTTGANAAARVNTDNPAGGGVDIISGDNFTSCTITP